MHALHPDSFYADEPMGQDPAGDHDLPTRVGLLNVTDECGECGSMALDGDTLDHNRGCPVVGEWQQDYDDEAWERECDARFEELQDRG